jgi:hypothetical protein
MLLIVSFQGNATSPVKNDLFFVHPINHQLNLISYSKLEYALFIKPSVALGPTAENELPPILSPFLRATLPHPLFPLFVSFFREKGEGGWGRGGHLFFSFRA